MVAKHKEEQSSYQFGSSSFRIALINCAYLRQQQKSALGTPFFGVVRARCANAKRPKSICESAHSPHKSISNRRGSSSASFTRTRKVTAPLPSTIRWS